MSSVLSGFIVKRKYMCKIWSEYRLTFHNTNRVNNKIYILMVGIYKTNDCTSNTLMMLATIILRDSFPNINLYPSPVVILFFSNLMAPTCYTACVCVYLQFCKLASQSVVQLKNNFKYYRKYQNTV